MVAIGPALHESDENVDPGILLVKPTNNRATHSESPICSSYSCSHLPKALASRAMTSTISSTTDFPLGSHPNNFLALIDAPNEVE